MGLISDLLLPSLAWKLTSLDTSEVVEGQFIPQDLTENIGADYTTTTTTARGAPFVHFSSEGGRSITFTARVFAKHQGLFGVLQDEVEDLVSKIRKTPKVDSDLGRPHVWLFEAGQYVSMNCVVRSVGGITYDRMRPLDGSLRGISCRFDLLEFVDYSTRSETANESLVVPILEGDSYELIASRHYGDPYVGEALRRRNPERPIPVAGETIHIPPKEKLMRGFRRVPQSKVLADKTSRVAFIEGKGS